MNFPYKAIIFDWSYTLVDLVEEDDRSALFHIYGILQEKGFSLPGFEELYDFYQHLFYELIRQSRETHQEACFDQVLNYLIIQSKIDLNGKISLKELLIMYYRKIYEPRRLYPEVLSTLKALKAAGVRMGIISNTTNPGFMKDYEKSMLGLDPFFEFSIYSSEVPYRKPHPSIYRLGVMRFGLDAKDILFLGDDKKMDVEGPQAVGLPAGWINRNSEKISDDIVPQYMIHSLADLLNLDSFKFKP